MTILAWRALSGTIYISCLSFRGLALFEKKAIYDIKIKAVDASHFKLYGSFIDANSQKELKQQSLLKNGKLHKALCQCSKGKNGSCEHVCATILLYKEQNPVGTAPMVKIEQTPIQISASARPPSPKLSQSQPHSQYEDREQEQVVKLEPKDSKLPVVSDSVKAKLPGWMKGEKPVKASKASKDGENSSSSGEKQVHNPYIQFCNEHRSKVKGENPTLSMTEISKILGQKWNALSDEEKAKYKNNYKQAAAQKIQQLVSEVSKEEKPETTSDAHKMHVLQSDGTFSQEATRKRKLVSVDDEDETEAPPKKKQKTEITPVPDEAPPAKLEQHSQVPDIETQNLLSKVLGSSKRKSETMRSVDDIFFSTKKNTATTSAPETKPAPVETSKPKDTEMDDIFFSKKPSKQQPVAKAVEPAPIVPTTIQNKKDDETDDIFFGKKRSNRTNIAAPIPPSVDMDAPKSTMSLTKRNEERQTVDDLFFKNEKKQQSESKPSTSTVDGKQKVSLKSLFKR